jgi:hypothetical protein
MSKTLALALLVAGGSAAFAQYKVTSGGAPPAEVPAAYADLLAKDGVKVTSDAGATICEIWLRKDLPTGPASSEQNLSLPEVPHGSLMGVIHFVQRGADRRGQQIKPGYYGLRYSYFPADGAHMGASPQRDFLILTPLAADTDPKATPDFDALMALSKKATGTPHPGVLSVWKGEAGQAAGISKEGDTDWVWHAQIGSTPISVILFGKYEG